MALAMETAMGRPSNVPMGAASQLATYTNDLLSRWGADGPVQTLPSRALQEASIAAAAVGLTWHANYPSRHLSPEERFRCLAALQSLFDAHNVTRSWGTEAMEIENNGRTWSVAVGRDGDHLRLHARTLLLAPGRAGAEWLAGVARSVGLETGADVSVGVRVETPSDVLAPLTDLTPDPRLSLDLETGRFRTYAFAVAGRVVATDVRGAGRITVRPAEGHPTGNTSFAVLWQPGTGGDESLKARRPSRSLLNHVMDQSVWRSPPGEHLPMEASLHVPCTDVRAHWSLQYWAGFSNLISSLASLAPGIASSSAVVYSPVIERLWTYGIDGDGRTRAPGLFLAGDGAGVSQGAMAAAVSGVVAGRAVAASLS